MVPMSPGTQEEAVGIFTALAQANRSGAMKAMGTLNTHIYRGIGSIVSRCSDSVNQFTRFFNVDPDEGTAPSCCVLCEQVEQAWGKCEEERDTARERASALERQHAELVERIGVLWTEAVEARAQSKRAALDVETRATTQAAALARADTAKERAETGRSRLLSHSASLETELRDTKQGRARLRHAYSSTQSKLEQARMDKEVLGAELDIFRRAAIEHECESAAAKQERARLRHAYASAQSKLEQARMDKEILGAELEVFRRAVIERQCILEKAAAELDELKELAATWSRDAADAKTILEGIRQETEATAQAIAEARDEKEHLEEQILELEVDRDALIRENARLERSLWLTESEAKAEVDALTAELEDLRETSIDEALAAKLRLELAAAESAHAETAEQHEAAKEQFDGDLAELRDLLSGKDRAVKAAQAETTRLAEETAALRQEKEEERRALRTQLETADSEQATLAVLLKEREDSLEESQDRLKYEAEKHKCGLGAAHSQIDAMQTELDQAHKELAALRAQLEGRAWTAEQDKEQTLRLVERAVHSIEAAAAGKPKNGHTVIALPAPVTIDVAMELRAAG